MEDEAKQTAQQQPQDKGKQDAELAQLFSSISELPLKYAEPVLQILADPKFDVNALKQKVQEVQQDARQDE